RGVTLSSGRLEADEAMVVGTEPTGPKGTTPGAEVHRGPWPDADDDRALLARVGRQDRQAFRVLVDRHLGVIVTLARRMLKDEAEADDIAQEALLRLWRSGETLELGPH